MANKTLNQVLQDVGAYIDQDTTLPTGTELTVRVNLVNQSLDEWGNAYQWKQLRVIYSPTFALSATSIGLPTNFKKLMSPPYDISLTSDNKYIEIRPEERFNKLSTDKYSYILGNEAGGKALIINPALTSGASLVLDYQSFPSSMATLQDVAVTSNPEFLVKRTIAYILEARADQRFPLVKAEADRIISTAIEEEDTPSGGMDNRVPDFARSGSFRIGEG